MTNQEKLNEIKVDCEMFQEIITYKLDNLVNELILSDFKKASKLSYVKDKLNDFINFLNENDLK